jgi:hypothetical protein
MKNVIFFTCGSSFYTCDYSLWRSIFNTKTKENGIRYFDKNYKNVWEKSVSDEKKEANMDGKQHDASYNLINSTKDYVIIKTFILVDEHNVAYNQSSELHGLRLRRGWNQSREKNIFRRQNGSYLNTTIYSKKIFMYQLEEKITIWERYFRKYIAEKNKNMII